MASIDGLVVALLAAGRSQRFGGDKLAAPLGGKLLLDWAVEAGRAVDAAQHVVVTGPDVPQRIVPADYMQLRNADASEGLGSSLRVAARHAREANASALLVLLGDMPFVRPSHLSVLVATFSIDPEAPVFSHAPGNAAQPPAILPAALFPALETLCGDSGARHLARGATLIEAPADTLIDVDTPADLALCAKLLGT
ncbi:MAG TPA: nucleotidyltransferase family protein [Sphingobium sp.]